MTEKTLLNKTEYDEDPYLKDLHERLTLIAKERKQKEEHSKQLLNRLKYLKGEETKNIKDVENIKTKYHRKYNSMLQIEIDLKEKVEIKTFQELELQKQKDFNKLMKIELTTKIKEKRNEYLEKLKSEMKSFNRAKKKNDELKKYIKMEEQNTNKNKYDFIKNQHILSDEKKKAKIIERKNKTREGLERRIDEETKKKDVLENNIKEIGEEEVEILKRIKTTTKIHEKWTFELEELDKRKASLAISLKKLKYKNMYSHKFDENKNLIENDIRLVKKEDEHTNINKYKYISKSPIKDLVREKYDSDTNNSKILIKLRNKSQSQK